MKKPPHQHALVDRFGKPARRRQCWRAGVMLLAVAAMVALAGCRSAERDLEMGQALGRPVGTSDASATAVDSSAARANADPSASSGVVTASRAASRVRQLPPLNDAGAREVALYLALYRAAWVSNVGGDRGHFLLDAPQPPPEEQFPEGVDVDAEMFFWRVIAGLAEFDAQFAWTPPDAPSQWTEPVRFPGTNHLSTRLAVTILERDPEDNIVRAEIADGTAHTGGSRQRVTARWRDGRWELERDRARMVW